MKDMINFGMFSIKILGYKFDISQSDERCVSHSAFGWFINTVSEDALPADAVRLVVFVGNTPRLLRSEGL